MVVEDVNVAVFHHLLATRCVDVPIRTVDGLPAAMRKILAAAIDEQAARALRSADPDAVSIFC